MASTISIAFKLEGDTKGFKDMANDANGLKTVMTGTIVEAEKLSKKLINFAALSTGIDAMQRSVGQLMAGMKSLSDAYGVQEAAETKLQTVMQQRMNATAEDVQSIKDLASAQQALGVIGDEVQLAGAQQVATFLDQKSSIETLLPAMNNLLAQQKGYDASASDAVSVGNMLGKAMQGQVSALTRVGISFTEAEEKVLKYGDESERAAILAEVITNNVGDMNADLAATDTGKMTQLENVLSDVKEDLGGMINGALPFVTISAHALTAAGSVLTLSSGVATFAKSVASAITKEKLITAATNVWAVAQKALNLILTMNPIGLIVVAIGALVAAIVYAYNNCESFRDICNQLWAAIKPLASAIMDGLVVAFTWLIEKAKQAWEWLKKILGLGGQTTAIDVEVNTATTDTTELKQKYANYTPPKTTTAKANTTAIWNEDATTLGGISDNIKLLNEQLQKATVNEAEYINEQIELWQAKADAITNAGKSLYEFGEGGSLVEEVTKSVAANNDAWSGTASTIKDIESNVRLLNEQLQTASIEEAAAINKEIELWNSKADAIKNAGLAADENNAKMGNLVKGGLSDLGSTMQSLSGIVSEGSSGWLSYGANVLSSVSQALPALASVVGGNFAAAFSGAAAQSQTVPFPYNLIALAASMAAVGSALASVPAFANGGVVSGPTLAMVGEYAGASNNPEIIAPLDKLRSLINTDGSGVGGTVDFEIDGYKLRGILNKVNTKSSRG